MAETYTEKSPQEEIVDEVATFANGVPDADINDLEVESDTSADFEADTVDTIRKMTRPKMMPKLTMRRNLRLTRLKRLSDSRR